MAWLTAVMTTMKDHYTQLSRELGFYQGIVEFLHLNVHAAMSDAHVAMAARIAVDMYHKRLMGEATPPDEPAALTEADVETLAQRDEREQVEHLRRRRFLTPHEL